MKLHLFKKTWLVLALALLLAALVGGSFAAFTNQGYRKGVAAVQSTESMFSSNRLTAYGNDENLQSDTFSYTKGDSAPESVEAVININNWSKEHPSQANPKDVGYTLSVTIEPLDNSNLSKGYTLKKNGGDGETVVTGTKSTYTSTLEGERLSSDVWVLTIPYADLTHNKITITAVPESGCVANDRSIGKVFYTALVDKDQQETFSWNASGILQDRTSTDAGSQDFSAFNFEIQGTGKGTGTLQWNADYLELDSWFLKSSGITPSTKSENGVNWKEITLILDSDENSYYLLQFYRVAPIASNETWDVISKKVQAETGYTPSGYIQFTAEKTENEAAQ